MKKLLSVALAAVMALSTAVSLIPTAWAESIDSAENGGINAPVASERPEGSWVYYEQNFDDEGMADLSDAALAEALGWTTTTATQKLSIENGALHAKMGNTNADKYQTVLHQGADKRMLTSVTVIEYDLKLLSTALNNAQAVHIIIGNDTADMNATKFTAKGAITTGLINKGAHTRYDGSTLTLTQRVASVQQPNKVPMAEGRTDCLEMDYHVKAVLDPITATYYLSINDVIVATLSDMENYGGALRALIGELTSKFTLELTKGAEALLDNVQIYGYEPAAPALVISEISANGNYQWVEVYNASTAPVNVYDYALYANNDPAASTNFGDSNVCYLRSGAREFSFMDTFYNPDYEDGSLGVGETAILVLPKNTQPDGKTVDDSEVRLYFRELGLSADAKIFMCDTTAELNTSGAMVVGLMAVDHADTDEVVGKIVGYNDSMRILLDSFVILTTDAANSKTGYEGLATYEKMVSAGVDFSEKETTVEISYWDEYADGVISRFGLVKHNEGCNPGSVSLDCRFIVTANVYDANDTSKVSQALRGRAGSEQTISDATKTYYKFIGYSVDGSEELVTDGKIILAHEGLSIVPVFERNAPYAKWYQESEVTADGTYTVRILGSINRKDIWSAGFRYSYSYVNERGKLIQVSTDEYVCKYMYKSVLADGEKKSASEFEDGEYLFALHLRNIPAGTATLTIDNKKQECKMVSDLIITVTPFVTEMVDGVEKTIWGEMYTTNPINVSIPSAANS